MPLRSKRSQNWTSMVICQYDFPCSTGGIKFSYRTNMSLTVTYSDKEGKQCFQNLQLPETSYHVCLEMLTYQCHVQWLIWQGHNTPMFGLSQSSSWCCRCSKATPGVAGHPTELVGENKLQVHLVKINWNLWIVFLIIHIFFSFMNFFADSSDGVVLLQPGFLSPGVKGWKRHVTIHYYLYWSVAMFLHNVTLLTWSSWFLQEQRFLQNCFQATVDNSCLWINS